MTAWKKLMTTACDRYTAKNEDLAAAMNMLERMLWNHRFMDSVFTTRNERNVVEALGDVGIEARFGDQCLLVNRGGRDKKITKPNQLKKWLTDKEAVLLREILKCPSP